MTRRFSRVGAIAILGASSLAMPQGASAEAQCHPAYDDICVPGNLSGRTTWKIPVKQGNQTQALCIKLGSWTGENPVVIEWNGRYAARRIEAKGYTNAVMVRVKQSRTPGTLRVYSPGSYDIDWEWNSCDTSMARNIENLGWVP